MKFHHFALFFLLIAISFFLTAQIMLITKMHRASVKKTEYDCLVAAVNATVEAVFSKADNTVTKADLELAEEVFFQTLAVLKEGTTDSAAMSGLRAYVLCFAVFEERGYYQYTFDAGNGYHWSELMPYEDGKIPESFFSETEMCLKGYHNLRFRTGKKYRVEQSGKGIWEQSIAPPCVFAIYAPQVSALPEDEASFLYAASGRRTEAYYVTEDNYCHLPFCKRCQAERIVARYATQRESAEDGAMPCEYCLK